MPTVEKGSLILVTGVTGYIGSHVALHLLEAGFRVRGSVRDEAKAKFLFDLFDPQFGQGQFETVVVKDMIADGAFDTAVKGCSGIVHLASIMTFSDKPEEVIPPTIKGALNILTSATTEPMIQSVVYTSSSTAALLPHPNEVIKVDKDTWDEEAVKIANGDKPDAFSVYGASKTEAERAFWQAITSTNPPFRTTAILPNANFGPILKPGAEYSSSTASWITALYHGKNLEQILGIPPQYFIDVRDTARLHAIALIDESCDRERVFGFAQPYNWNDILAILRKQNPGKTFEEDVPGMGKDLSEIIPSARAEELLRKHYGRGWISLEESVKATTEILTSK